MTRRTALCTILCSTPALRAQDKSKRMLWGDESRLGRPFSKDPSVLRIGGRYLLYYSMPPYPDKRANNGWGIGIAESKNLLDWTKIAEIAPVADYEAKGICSPFIKRFDGKIHLFYQTYGGGPADSMCHATSSDGLHFERDATNPVFRSRGDWNSGRAIDGEVVRFKDRWFFYAATRDPQSKVQIISAGVSSTGFGRDAWTMAADRPVLKPELTWEKDCVEAPAMIRRGDTLYMFYGGAYNNAPQQIGCARSSDGVTWERIFQEPFLPAGVPGSWNSSESGHPAIFEDDDGQTYLFYQGNNDKGKTWLLSFEKIGWRDGKPYLMA